MKRKMYNTTGEISHSIDQALRVEIESDQELVTKLLQWLIDHPEIDTFRGGYCGLGNYIGWFPAEHLEELNHFFAKTRYDLCMDMYDGNED